MEHICQKKYIHLLRKEYLSEFSLNHFNAKNIVS